MKEDAIVDIRDLTLDFETIDGTLKVLQGVNILIEQGEVVGIVGETGCGKSIMAKTLLGILPMPPGRVRRGEVRFLGQDLLKMNQTSRELLKQKIAYIPQDPMASLNPVFSIGTLMVDMIVWNWSGQRLAEYLWKRRRGSIRERGEAHAAELLDRVHIPDPRSILAKYPLELSGGMRQRVLLAMALRGEPKLLVADEPTTALDATIQKRIVFLIQEKIEEEKLSGLYITHNLGVARIVCGRTYVMYAGTVVETGKTGALLDRPLHPYTRGLVNSIPKLTGEPFRGIVGRVPDYLSPPTGCRFHPRCDRKEEICSEEAPKLIQVEEDRFVACRLFR